MNVFVDKHHIGLLYSLQLLFEKRLGWNLFTPIGEDWFTNGYWKIAEPYGNHPSTIKQFLSLDNTFKPTSTMNSLSTIIDKNQDYYLIKDEQNNTTHKAITLEQFKSMPIDIIIASIPSHLQPYHELITKFKPKAKLIYQIGNDFGQTDWTIVNNLMSSTLPNQVPVGKNVIFYHQEFDLNIFKYTEPKQTNKITSFVHLLPNKEIYDIYSSQLPGYKFKAYGSGCPDGAITPMTDIARIMSESVFGWQIKPGGDGFGHVIHSWYACGRPIITNGSDYLFKLGGQLLEDGITCLDLEKHSFNENLELIKKYSQPEEHQKLCLNTYQRFKQVVNFEAEEIQLRNFLNYLI